MNSKRRPNKEEKKWFDSILEFGCVVCQKEMGIESPAEIHHLNGGSNHMETIPLCYPHHRQGISNSECVSRHPFFDRFESRYGSEDELLNYLKENVA